MDRIPVKSSSIASIGYDPDSETLEIEFLDSRIFHLDVNISVYQYFDVPQRVYEELISADSKGKYLAENINCVYRYATEHREKDCWCDPEIEKYDSGDLYIHREIH
jgi:hypothetical protein